MKLSFWLFLFTLSLLFTYPTTAHAAMSSKRIQQMDSAQSGTKAVGKISKRKTLREKIGRKFYKIKQKLTQWWKTAGVSFPSGKLLTSLVFLVLSIVFFAIGGLTTLGVLFNTLGSVAVIGALLFFVLWLSERSAVPKPTN